MRKPQLLSIYGERLFAISQVLESGGLTEEDFDGLVREVKLALRSSLQKFQRTGTGDITIKSAACRFLMQLLDLSTVLEFCDHEDFTRRLLDVESRFGEFYFSYSLRQAV